MTPLDNEPESQGNSAQLVADQSAALAFLADPDTHAGQAVERIDTHAATVFLAGARAYKVKRAVRFPYMDFSTLRRRERACKREVELNRRTAPDIYLAARPLTRRPDGQLDLDGDGEAVEWVVEMRRFEQAGLLDSLAAAGDLNAPLMTEMTDIVAGFHARAEILTPQSAPHAGAEGMRWVIEESLSEIAERLDLFRVTDISALTPVAGAMLDRFQTTLDARLKGGFVRRCHGDLHLRNICLIDGVPTLFDCIEFDDKLACIDVLYDLAFLLMDLDHRGLRRLANLVLNRYLQQSGDLSGLAVLPLFLAARALIRAKVGASAEANQRRTHDRHRLQAEARHYFARAQAYFTPPAPRLIAVGGLSGSGKTTLARDLAPDIGAAPGAVHLRSDVIRKSLCGAEEFDRLPPQAYGAAMNKRVYAEILSRARVTLRAGQAVIADAVFAMPDERGALESLATDLGITFRGLWLTTRRDRLVERLDGRTHDASDADATVLEQQLDYEIGSVTWRHLDAGGTKQEVLEAGRKMLLS